MPPIHHLLPNLFVVALALFCLAGELYLCHMTRASGFVWKAAAFGYALVTRGLLAFHVWPAVFVDHSGQVILPFYILFGIGIVLTVLKLRSVYRSSIPAGRKES